MSIEEKLSLLESNLANCRALMDQYEVDHAIDMANVSLGIKCITAGRVLVLHTMERHPDWTVLDCAKWWKTEFPGLFWGKQC